MVRLSLKRRAREEERSGNLSGRLVTLYDPSNPASEAYRTLRTGLLYAVVDAPPRVISVTSPGPTEGKSTVCANLGVVLSQANKSTLLIDGDLRRPSLHAVFGLRNINGLVNAITGERGLQEVLCEPLPGLMVCPSGPVPPNPAELLSSNRFAALVEEARQRFDYVLIDSPPVEPVADPLILATQADGVLLVLDGQRTRKGSLRKALHDLRGVKANVLGTVMNNFDGGRGGYAYRGYTR